MFIFIFMFMFMFINITSQNQLFFFVVFQFYDGSIVFRFKKLLNFQLKNLMNDKWELQKKRIILKKRLEKDLQ